MTPTRTDPLATTGYFAWASLAWPARSLGGVLTSASTTRTVTFAVARPFFAVVPLLTV